MSGKGTSLAPVEAANYLRHKPDPAIEDRRLPSPCLRSTGTDTRKPLDAAAAVIIGQRVRPGLESAYDDWQGDLNSAAPKYPGFLAAEVTPPTTRSSADTTAVIVRS